MVGMAHPQAWFVCYSFHRIRAVLFAKKKVLHDGYSVHCGKKVRLEKRKALPLGSGFVLGGTTCKEAREREGKERRMACTLSID
jgi:hypothetical protein